MKISTHASTPGLDGYQEMDRFSVYHAAHKRLLQEDAAYRRQHSSYIAGIVCVAILPFAGFAVAGALGLLLSAVALVGAVAGIVRLAFRQQRFMNEKIGNVLRREMA